MDSRTRSAFGLLVLAQACHSVEEYALRLYDVLGLTRFVSRLFSADPATGFAIANTVIFLFGLGTAPLLVGGSLYLAASLRRKMP